MEGERVGSAEPDGINTEGNDNDAVSEGDRSHIPTDEVIAKLADLGLDPNVIALTIGATTSKVRSVLTVRRSVNLPSPAERQLAEEVRTLTHTAIQQAALLLQFGHTDQKLAIIKSLLGNAGRLIGQESGGSTDAMRITLEELFKETRTVPVRQTVVTDEEIIDVESLDSPASPIPITPISNRDPASTPTAPPPAPPASTPAAKKAAIDAAAIKALLESINNQDEGATITEVQY